jgi:NAD(P)-dependent dehydrogenase (short-subunit alcohol dehydrogenase family)
MEDLRDMFSLRGRCALVTGAGSGIGRDVAGALAQFGAVVGLMDVDGVQAGAAAEEIQAAGHHAIPIVCDVTSAEEVDQVVADFARDVGRLDILVANAGIADRAEAIEMSEKQWDRVVEVNLKGVWLANQSAGRQMIRAGGGGAIVNMASVTAVVGIQTGNANYAAAKGGVAALTRTLAVEWAPHGVRVNAIAPAQVRTPLVERLLSQRADAEDYFLRRIPLGRLGVGADIAGPVVFLCSSASAWMTGHLLMVDGGNSIAF